MACHKTNMLASITVLAGSPTGMTGTHTYQYDVLGRRVRKTVTGATPSDTVYIHLGQRVYAEYPATVSWSNPSRFYAYGSYVDEPIALIKFAAPGAGQMERFYYHRNQQYSITALTNQAGAVVERYAYTAYGEPTILDSAGTTTRTSSAYGNPYLYTARAYDSESGLHYFRARMYEGRKGRFLSHDPIEYPDGWNTYAGWFSLYFVDPYGLAIDDPNGDLLGNDGFYDCTGGKYETPGFAFNIGRGPVNIQAVATGSIAHKKCKKCCPGRGEVQDELFSAAFNVKISAKGGPWRFGKDIDGDEEGGVKYEGFIGIEAFGDIMFSGGGAWKTDGCTGAESTTVCVSGQGEVGLRGGGYLAAKWWRWRSKVGAVVTGSVRSSLTACFKCGPGPVCTPKSVKLCSGYRVSATAYFGPMGNYTHDLIDQGICVDFL